jgi:hypothetical protein
VAPCVHAGAKCDLLAGMPPRHVSSSHIRLEFTLIERAGRGAMLAPSGEVSAAGPASAASVAGLLLTAAADRLPLRSPVVN